MKLCVTRLWQALLAVESAETPQPQWEADAPNVLPDDTERLAPNKLPSASSLAKSGSLAGEVRDASEMEVDCPPVSMRRLSKPEASDDVATAHTEVRPQPVRMPACEPRQRAVGA